MDLSAFVESMLSDIRLNAKSQPRERLTVASFVDDIASNARLHADYRGLDFAVEPGPPDLAVTADPQLLASAVTNLLHKRVQIHAAGGARHPPCLHQGHASPDRGRRRVRWSSNGSRRPVSTVWSAARIRSQRARSWAVHCSEGGLCPRRRDRHPQHARQRLRLRDRHTAGCGRSTGRYLDRARRQAESHLWSCAPRLERYRIASCRRSMGTLSRAALGRATVRLRVRPFRRRRGHRQHDGPDGAYAWVGPATPVRLAIPRGASRCGRRPGSGNT
jgi:hypothetical protein